MSLVFSCLAKHIVKRASLVFSSLPTSMKIRVWNESVVTPFQERERPGEIWFISMRSSDFRAELAKLVGCPAFIRVSWVRFLAGTKFYGFFFKLRGIWLRLVRNWILTRETGVRISIMSAGKNLTETHDLPRSQYTDSNMNP